MDYRSYYNVGALTKISMLQRLHLLNKYEHNHGIVEYIQEGRKCYTAIDNRDTLERVLEYYNSLPGTSATWFYVRDICIADEDGVEILRK